jgi:hypothetical protein
VDSSDHLKLVPPPAAGWRRTPGRLALRPFPALTAFVAVAAEAGLHAADAARLALERALVLRDIAPLGFDLDAARHDLLLVAATARPRRPLDAGQARHIRVLRLGRRVRQQDVSRGLVLTLPERLLTRAREVAQPETFDARVVPELVAWEIAATLEGRTMGEWALTVLAAARVAG